MLHGDRVDGLGVGERRPRAGAGAGRSGLRRATSRWRSRSRRVRGPAADFHTASVGVRRPRGVAPATVAYLDRHRGGRHESWRSLHRSAEPRGRAGGCSTSWCGPGFDAASSAPGACGGRTGSHPVRGHRGGPLSSGAKSGCGTAFPSPPRRLPRPQDARREGRAKALDGSSSPGCGPWAHDLHPAVDRLLFAVGVDPRSPPTSPTVNLLLEIGPPVAVSWVRPAWPAGTPSAGQRARIGGLRARRGIAGAGRATLGDAGRTAAGGP